MHLISWFLVILFQQRSLPILYNLSYKGKTELWYLWNWWAKTLCFYNINNPSQCCINQHTETKQSCYTYASDKPLLRASITSTISPNIYKPAYKYKTEHWYFSIWWANTLYFHNINNLYQCHINKHTKTKQSCNISSSQEVILTTSITSTSSPNVV